MTLMASIKLFLWLSSNDILHLSLQVNPPLVLPFLLEPTYLHMSEYSFTFLLSVYQLAIPLFMPQTHHHTLTHSSLHSASVKWKKIVLWTTLLHASMGIARLTIYFHNIVQWHTRTGLLLNLHNEGSPSGQGSSELWSRAKTGSQAVIEWVTTF